MDFYIITGTSRGLGAALAAELMQGDSHIHCISRTPNNELLQAAQRQQKAVYFHPFDLAKAAGIDEFMSQILNEIPETARSVTLVNNAGVLGPIAPIGSSDHAELELNIQVNLVAPMLLTSSFIRHTSQLPLTKTILNVSSGAGKKPYQGWGAYCSAKAGLDMFTKCVGAEQEGRPFPVKMVSLAPGVIDTDMQQLIRETPEEQFPHVSRFVTLKQEEKLQSSEATAKQIVQWLQKGQYEHGAVLDLRDFWQ
jgi:benzil reductase ((S)-benzoin forming)